MQNKIIYEYYLFKYCSIINFDENLKRVNLFTLRDKHFWNRDKVCGMTGELPKAVIARFDNTARVQLFSAPAYTTWVRKGFRKK